MKRVANPWKVTTRTTHTTRQGRVHQMNIATMPRAFGKEDRDAI
jgi:hypothetical protein